MSNWYFWKNETALGILYLSFLFIVLLGGQAKTLMFVHVSPDEESYAETISTLKFAERVATVELGAAQSNKESREVRDLKDQARFPS
jgi:hypothetical protein